LTFFTNAQSDYSDEKFEVSLGDLSSSVYENDSTSNAIVIYELGKSYIEDPHFNLIFKVKRKLKILDKRGFQKANIVISLYKDGNEKESIENIRATTHNLVDDKIIQSELSEASIIKERASENRTLYKFAMPNVKEGSVITYSYEIKSPFLYEFKTWYFQSDIPKIHSEYHTSIPGNYQYYIRLNGELEIDSINEEVRPNCVKGGRGTSADCFDAQYIMKNVPSFTGESYMPAYKNYLSRLDYQLGSIIGFDGSSKFFKRIDERLKESKGFGGQMNKRKIVKDLIDKKSFSAESELNRLKQIYSFVQNNYAWNGDYGVSENNSIKNLLGNKYGNVCEINLLLHNLLQEFGIDSNPVILSKRENGIINKKRPKDSDFNYLIVQATLKGKSYLLDATDKHLQFNELPFKCLNQIGFLLDFKNGSRWIPVNAKEPAIKEYKLKLHAKGENGFSGNAIVNFKGHYALKARKSYKNSLTESFLNDELDNFHLIEVTKHEIMPFTNDSTTFRAKYNIDYVAEPIGSKLYLNPFLFKMFPENPFGSIERMYPVDFGFPSNYNYEIEFQLGEQYKIIKAPERTVFEMPNNMGAAELSCKKTVNSISVNLGFSLNKGVYYPNEYSLLKTFVENIIKTQNAGTIILEKH